MSTSIPALTSVNDILDADLIVVTHSAGASEKMTGADLKKNFDIIIASGTTVSGPALHAGSTVRIYFNSAITALNASTALVINYNKANITVKAPKDGSLIDYVAKAVGNDFIYCQAHTTLELLYNGTDFVIIGNPVVVSNNDYTIYADGSIIDNRYSFTEYESFETVPNDAVIRKYVPLVKDHIYLLEAYCYDDVNEIRINVTIDERVFVMEKTSYAGTIMGGQLIFYCDANQNCEFRYSFNHSGGSRKIRYSITDLGKIK